VAFTGWARFLASAGLVLALVVVISGCSGSGESGAGGTADALVTPTVVEPAAEPSPDPTATPSPIPTPKPTAAPTPTPTPDLALFVDSALADLRDAKHLEIDKLTTTTITGIDLVTRVRQLVDVDRGVQSSQVSFEGAGWDLIGAGPELDASAPEQSVLDLTLMYVFEGDGTMLFTAEPLPEDADPEAPWLEIRPYDVAAGDRNSVALAFASDPLAAQAGLAFYTSFDMHVPNDDAYWLLPVETVDGLQVYDIDPAELTGFTQMRLDFLGARVHTIEVNFSGIFGELAAMGARELAGFEMQDRFEIAYEPVSIDVPDPEQVARQPAPTEPLALLRQADLCFARDDFEFSVRPLTVPCTEPHFAEVFHVSNIDAPYEAPYPGDDELFGLALTECNTTFQPATGVHLETTVHTVQFWHPDATSWAAYDREVACFIRFNEPSSTVLTELDPLRTDEYVSTFGVQTGDCLDAESVFSLVFALVDCDEPHLFEVYHSSSVDRQAYPGDAQMLAETDRVCLDAFGESTGQDYATSDWAIERLHPNEYSWETYGDRQISCLVTLFEPVSRSVFASREATMARADWATGYFQAEVYKLLLEELGYNVSPPSELELSPSLAYLGMSEGRFDFWVNSWFPGHLSWFEAERADGSLVGDHLSRIGNEVPAGGLQGFLITKAVAEEHGITTLEGLYGDPELSALFDPDGNGVGNLYGCPETWTCDDIITEMACQLDVEIDQIQENYDSMVEEAIQLANAGEPMVIYTWTPSTYITMLRPGNEVMWISTEGEITDQNCADHRNGELFAQPDAVAAISADECLQNSRGECRLGWTVADIQVTARTDFLDANPVAAELFRQVTFSSLDVSLAVAEQDATDRSASAVEAIAKRWIVQNQDLTNAWLEAARAAG